MWVGYGERAAYICVLVVYVSYVTLSVVRMCYILYFVFFRTPLKMRCYTSRGYPINKFKFKFLADRTGSLRRAFCSVWKALSASSVHLT